MRNLERRNKLDELRANHSELENNFIDELAAGHVDRRQFLQRGAVLGLSAGAMGAILAACGGANNTSSPTTGSKGTSTGGTLKRGGTLKLASQVPAGAVNPLLVDDSGSLCVLSQVGEFLTLDNPLADRLQPMLATKWTASANGTVWTFNIRTGVKFHNGQPMTADDVVYTFQQLSDPKNASAALSTFDGVLKPTGVVKVDSHTVAFHLEAANGNFPYLVSSDNYNAIIVPKGTDYKTWDKTMIGTGAFKLSSYTTNQGANFSANKDYWGGAPYLDGTEFTFYASQQPQITALQGGTVDVIVQFTATGAQAILQNASQYKIISVKSSGHRELSMRCDKAPFNDARVRQAIALSVDRPAMIKGLLQGYGQLGNDSPFAPIFPSTNTSVPQRTQNIAKAKALLKEAGHPSGFTAQLDTEQYQEIPQLATVFKQDAAKIGVNINLNVETQSNYYGQATFGNSDWLDAEMSLVDYGGRGVPNAFLESALATGGPWNAAHFSNSEFDSLVKKYVAAVDLTSQRQYSGQIQRLLLDQTPMVIPYFLTFPTASTHSVGGMIPTAISQIFLSKAYMS
jgi:peptide/nickel transport system substrate-binding protein